MGNQNRLHHSPNRRGGHQQAIGALWEIEARHSLRNLDVIAGAEGVRIRDMYCGEVEMAEQQAVWLDLDELKQLAEVLADAVKVMEGGGRYWQSNAERVNPRLMLDRLQAEREVERDAEITDLRAKLAGLQNDDDRVADVVIHNPGDRKIGVIKVLREYAWELREQRLGLAEAKAIVDGPMPMRFVMGLDPDDADRLATALRAAGAEVAVDTWSTRAERKA